MQLAFHVGPLTDYFLAAVRQDAVRAGDPGAAPSRDQVRERIEEWQAFVSDGLVASGHVRNPVRWSEDPAPAWTFGLPADAVRALKLLLVHGDDPPPPEQLPDDPEQHPVWRAAVEADFGEHPHPDVLVPEFWLPGDHDFTFRCPYPDGHEVQTGWTRPLLASCRAITDRLVIGGADAASGLAAGPAPARDDGVRALAAFAAAAFLLAAERAVAHDLPLLIHA
jgi:hypothetical protein